MSTLDENEEQDNDQDGPEEDLVELDLQIDISKESHERLLEMVTAEGLALEDFIVSVLEGLANTPDDGDEESGE